MLKQLLKIEGVDFLSKKQQTAILGGIDRCCIRVPSNGITSSNNEISDGDENDPPKPANCAIPECANARCCK